MNLQKWLEIVKAILPLILMSVPKLAPISNEVTNAVMEAEKIHGSDPGAVKLEHVVNIAKQAAQATDELRGQADEVAGTAREVVDAAIPLVNVIEKHLTAEGASVPPPAA